MSSNTEPKKKKPSDIFILLIQTILEIETLKNSLTKDTPIDSEKYAKNNSRLIDRAIYVNELLVEFDSLFVDKKGNSGQ